MQAEEKVDSDDQAKQAGGIKNKCDHIQRLRCHSCPPPSCTDSSEAELGLVANALSIASLT